MKKNNILNIIITLVCLFSLTIFSYFMFRLDIVPTKYLLLGYIILILLIAILLKNIFSKSKKITKIISLIVMTILSFISILANIYLNNTYNFLSNTKNEYETLTYSVVVLKEGNYKNIKDLNNKKISYISDDYKKEIEKNLKEKIKYTSIVSEDFSNLPVDLINKDTDALCLEESYLTIIYEAVEDFKDKIKTIYTFDIKVKSHEEETNINITEEPFILYISGIDQYGNVNSVRGRSDVNQLIVINPKTHDILLVNTPRDYYVQLAGTTGLKDKLTHAGIYGINKSIKTLENLYDIDIDHYLRVNFNTLIKLVDVIGGIDIYSDSSFTPWTNGKVYINKGWNHLNGKEALAYARERHAYIDGDHHRGRNQQQVITEILNKVTSSSVLISKYNSILNALNKSFQTDMDMNVITSFIKYQLEYMPTWNIESIAAYGYNSYNYTYSMGKSYNLYVMEPDYESVEKVKIKINEIINKQTSSKEK